MKKMWDKVKCFFGFHKWRNIDKEPLPNLKPGESYCYSDLHKCDHCGKEEYKGMGWIY